MSEIPIHASVAVVVERDGRYLMTLEDRGLPGGPVWYFPAGALERGESLAAAARREALQETGYLVEPQRVIRIDHGTFPKLPELHWWRFAVAARVLDARPSQAPEPDVLAVEWVTLDEIPERPLRAADALQLALHASAADGLDVGAAVLSSDGALEGFIA